MWPLVPRLQRGGAGGQPVGTRGGAAAVALAGTAQAPARRGRLHGRRVHGAAPRRRASAEPHFQVRRFETFRVGMDGREIERWLLSQSPELLASLLTRGGPLVTRVAVQENS